MTRRRIPSPRVLLPIVSLVCVALLISGCGAGSGNSTHNTTGAAPNTITIKNFAFTPGTITVSPGATVTVKNDDSATHTVTATDRSTFDTGNVASGMTKTFTAPEKPGTYPYFCTIHNYMQGTLTVK